MILVNTKHSYPSVADDIAATPTTADGSPESMIAATADLMEVTGGDWPDLTDDYVAQHGDYIAATSDGRIVAVFRSTGATHIANHPSGLPKVRFTLQMAPEAAHLIGAPMPGGPWRRGESRGTRAVPTPRDFLPLDDLTDGDHSVYRRRLHAVAVAHAAGHAIESAAEAAARPYSGSDTSWTDRAVVGGADVRAFPDGVIHVLPPAGSRVIIETAH